jgi:hypothetical protein
MKSFLFLLFLSVFILPYPSFSQSTPVLTERQVIQRQRIIEGRSSGELSKNESIRLGIQQRNIQQKKRIAKANAAQNCASLNIARQKNDEETR